MSISVRINTHGRVNNFSLHLTLHIHLCFYSIYVVEKVSTFFLPHWQILFFRCKLGRTLCLLCCYLSTCHPAEIKFPLKAPWNYTFFFFPFFLPSLPSPSDLQDKYHNLSLLSCLACGLDDILAMPSVFPAFSSLGQTQRASEAYCTSLTFLKVQSSLLFILSKSRLIEALLLICSAIVCLWHCECGSAVLSCPCVWL